MKRRLLSLTLILYTFCILSGQEQVVKLNETAGLEQIYGKSRSSKKLLSMNDLDMESGYVLYSFDTRTDLEKQVLFQVENVRDYAVIYLNGEQTGILTSGSKSLSVDLPPGQSTIQIYVENRGRITYGPEILDNSRGLFGKASLGEKIISDWTITPLNIRDCEVEKLNFSKDTTNKLPSFHKGYFTLDKVESRHLDTTGWGMGEVWINGQYVGAYWEDEAQKSLPISVSTLKKGKNEVVIFDLRHNGPDIVRITDKPVFK